MNNTNKIRVLSRIVASIVLAGGLVSPTHAQSAEAAATPGTTPSEDWGWHVQATSTTQKHGGFRSPYAADNSLLPTESAKETLDATLFLGLRLWKGGEFYLNPEFDQGYGLANTLGMAGFASGAAYKVGHDTPYARLHRAFLRQTFALGETGGAQESAANQLAGWRSDDRVTVTLGKFSVVDIFDNNRYAHDPRADFLNWSVIDGGAFDYAADSWGFSVGAAAEWTQGPWTLRGGMFAMSKEPNSETLDGGFGQHQWLLELEHRHEWLGHPGALRVLGFQTQARMARYEDALALGQMPADLGSLRRFASKQGVVLNLEQELAQDLGLFARYSMNDGRTEAYDFTDINKSISAGLQIQGSHWQQPTHSAGVALARNELSDAARRFFAAGGMGILIGDGQLPHYQPEQIAELYYAVRVAPWLSVTADYQHIVHPAYNADRGPVSVWGLRLHAEY